MKSEEQPASSTIVRSLLSSYIGMIAEIYEGGFPVKATGRPAAITTQFKSLLNANFHSLKSPFQYAAKLNVSEVYLNEVVKKSTGLSISDNIRNEIVLQAKRLLFYTDMSVKEIALSLGYEDWAYFTRLFTKASNLSPTQFRQQYLK
jgi:AraC-like DNA-binding protein